MQSLSTMHFHKSEAAASPFPAMQVVKQVWFCLHLISQSWRAGKHLWSARQAFNWLGHFSWIHCWGVAMASSVEGSIEPRQWLASAHLATSMAAWLPFPPKQKVQQFFPVPHFFWQSWRAGMHFGSFWQFAHWLGHFYSIHCCGSSIFWTPILKE